jgi:hypothetical protein
VSDPFDYDDTLLRLHLSAAVPLAADYWKTLPDSRKKRLQECVDIIAAHGDSILYKTPNTREAINALVDALAILTLEQGEVRAFRLRFKSARRKKDEKDRS